MSKKAIVFTANTLHVAQANLMIDSLFDPEKGNFQGDLWVISTHLSARCQSFLDSRGIRYLINPLPSVQNWPYRSEIARAQPEFQRGDLNEDDAFLLYRNKRMSKLIICDWVEKFGAAYDAIALCDNDLYFQRDVQDLFAKSAGVDPNVLWYWQEENPNLPGTNLWIKNFNYSRFHSSYGMDFGMHEINIGFVIATPERMAHVFDRVRKLFWSLKIELFRDHKWHDQDLVRVIRAQDPHMFRLFDDGDVLHLCNGGQTMVEEPTPMHFYHKKTQEKPYIIHFAGGAWKPFPSIAASFKADDGAYFFMEEQTERFDRIRAQTDYDPFDRPTPLFSKHNIRTRESARAEWRALKAQSDKQSLLLFSWLQTGSHKPLRATLNDLLAQNTYDLAVIDGNVTHKNHENLICEDLPDLMARVTQTVRNDNFGRSFGYVRDDIPEEAISGAIAAMVQEYRCLPRNARAVANAAYLYLQKTLTFYQPNVVVVWGAFLVCSRILKHICAQRGIPFVTMELSVLPNSVAFDVAGHMGESWVARDLEGFMALPLTPQDHTLAQDYLAKVRAEGANRNRPVPVTISTQEKLAAFTASRKKRVVYFGSNDAMSGNVPYDARAKQFHSPFYADNDDVVRHLSAVFATDPDIELIYKPHPITITRGLDLSRSYPGVTVLADANLSECLAIADLAIVKVSQASYEALLRDVPVLMVGRHQLSGSGALYELSARGALETEVRAALAQGLTAQQKAAFTDHVARMMRYYAYGVTGADYLRPQAQLIPDLAALINGEPPDHLRIEAEALAASTKPAREPNENPCFSIIMPVYNAEDYLDDCIASILEQSFGDFELICVNNGSTDGSQKIIDYFASRDKRVKPLYQEEANQRSARNNGVAHAKGTYIQFFDADDLIVPSAYEELKTTLEETGADVVYFFFDEMYNTARIGNPRHNAFKPYLPDAPLFRMEEKHKALFAQYPFPWAKVFRADVLRRNELLFDLDCANFDDNPQNLRTLLSCENIYVLNKPFYKFRINENSMTQSVNPRVYGMVDAIRLMNEIYQKFGRYEEFQPSYVPYKIHLVYFAWTKLPDDLKADYWKTIPSLFSRSDEDFFVADESFSKFSYLTMEKVEFVRRALSGCPFEVAPPPQEQPAPIEVPQVNVYRTPFEAQFVPRVSGKLKTMSPKMFMICKKLYRSIRPIG